MNKTKKIIGIFMGLIGIGLVSLNLFPREHEPKSVTIIGGADGPTSIFLASKVGSDHSLIYIILGIVLILAGMVIVIKRKR